MDTTFIKVRSKLQALTQNLTQRVKLTKSVVLLEGSQTSSASSSDQSRAKVKTLGWLEAVSRNGVAEFLFFQLMSLHNLEKYLVALTAIWFHFDEFKQGGPHDWLPAATWKLKAISAVDKDRAEPRKPVSKWPVPVTSEYALISSQMSRKQNNMGDSLTFP
jgi:hypothetical protein